MKVLIVDDEENICRRLQRELKKEGFEVEYTTSPAGVIERLYNAKRDKKPYELLLLDLRMPKINGFELLKEIREARLDIDVIIITGYGDEDKAMGAIRLGAVDYLRKPISLEDLHTAIFRIQQKRAVEAKQALRHSILVVDDEKDICTRIKRELDREGYQTAVAYDGVEGLDYFKDYRVDVVIADIRMPKMGGLEMLKACREITHDFVSIIVTGHGDHETAIEALKLGVSNYLRKPISLEELAVSVSKGTDLLLLRRGLSARRRELEIETALKEQYAKNLEKMVEERTKALRESEEKYRGLFESSRDAIMTLEPPSWRFTSGNPATVNIFAAKNEEDFISHGPWDVSPERQPDGRASAEKTKEMIETAMREGSHFFEWMHRRIGGKEFPTDVLLTRVELRGKVILQATVRDITERKRAEEARKQAEEQTKQLQEYLQLQIERMPIGLIVWDTEFHVQSWNPAAEKIFGFTKEEALGKHPYDLIVPKEARPRIDDIWRRLLEGDMTAHSTNENITKDGRIIICEWSNTPLKKADGTMGVLSMVQDITARKQAEEALLESEEHYRSLAENIDFGVTMIDKDFKIIMTNAQIGRWFNKPTSKFVSKNCFKEFEKRQAICQHCPGVKAMATGQPHQVETEGVRDDGSRFSVLVHAFPLFNPDGATKEFIEVIEDITERKRAGEALRDSERRYRILFESAGDAIFIHDLKGRFLEMNQGTCDCLGYSREELLQMTSMEIDTPEYAAQAPEKIRELQQCGHIIFETAYVRRDGATIPIEASSRIIDYAGEPAALTIARDISERKRLEARLAQAQKMEAIGTLAGGIAHDFNNILTAVIGYADLAVDKAPEGSRQQANLQEVLKAGMRAKDLVQQILMFSRQSKQEQKPLQMDSIVKEGLKMLRASIPTTVEIRPNIQRECGIALGDPTQIYQVLVNLCVNAAHAMREKGGVLEVSLMNVDIDAASAQHPDLQSGPYVRLTVSDTGHGMDRAVMERIFDPYFTTKGPSEGTGMGLAVVHGIVKGHGGVITVDSEPGKGTAFHVYFPRIERGGAPEAEAAASIPTGGERILFVDDEKILVDMVKQMIESLGYKVVGRTSSIEALEAFRAQPGQFDLVITDQTMPNMTGEMLAKELLRIRPDIPIILCTGYSESITEEKVRAMGIRKLIMKPVVRSELARTIRGVLDQKTSVTIQPQIHTDERS